MPRLIFLLGLLATLGCAMDENLLRIGARDPSPELPHLVEPEIPWATVAMRNTNTPPAIKPVAHRGVVDPPANRDRRQAVLTLEGREYTVELVETAEKEPPVRTVALQQATPSAAPVPLPAEDDAGARLPTDAETLALNLPSALAMVGGQHPAVGIAQWRVREAYAQLAQAKVLWLPSIQAGVGFHRHDGNYQASDGSIVDVDRNSFQYGLGTGATGAGTTPQPGVVARFHLADALFQPKIAEKTAWARGHAANAVVNQQLLTAALAYTELLRAAQDRSIVDASRTRTAELAKLTDDFASAGQGLQADADRMATELALLESRQVRAQEGIALASARLAQAISIDASQTIVPTDVTVVPLELIGADGDKASLIQTGLATRPELKEAQALVAAACEAFRREKYAPFVPSVLLGFSTGGFGGGLGSPIENVESRYDFDALLTWEVRNLGFGERAARRETSARVRQARFSQLRDLDQIARQISEASSQVQFRRAQIGITERAIQSAQDSYERNLARIRDGQGLPLEVLQSVQALETAHRAYLEAVIDHNRAQFQLQWAIGWAVSEPANPPVG